MALIGKHSKTNSIPDWTQGELDNVVAGGSPPLLPSGTTLSQITLPTDWNADIPITGTLEQDQNNVAVDGVTITGNGTSGDPLVAAGGGVSSLNTLTGAVTISAGANITLTPSGNDIEIAASGGAVDSVNGQTGVVVLDTSDIAEAADANYVSDAELTVLQNTSGTNTGDVTVSDTSEIDLSLTGQLLSASIVAGSIDESKLDTSVNASLDLADSALQSGDNVSELTNDAGYITSAGAPVQSVNSATGTVVLDADDIDDSLTINRFVTVADTVKLGNLSGTNTGDQDLSGLVPYTSATSNIALNTRFIGFGTTPTCEIDIDSSNTNSAVLRLGTYTIGSSEGGPYNNGFYQGGSQQYTFHLIRNNATHALMAGGVNGDARRRFILSANGKMAWGTGSAVRDTEMERNTSGGLLLTGPAGAVISTVKAAASQTAHLSQWENSSGTALSYIRADGSCKPVQLADSAAVNDSIYYSTTASKLVYKDSGGTVNNLY